jgi:hypothetical protein
MAAASSSGRFRRADLGRRALLSASLVLLLTAVLIVATGGASGTVMGLRLSMRSPRSALWMATGLAAVWAAMAIRAGAMPRDVDAIGEAIVRQLSRLPLLLGVVMFAGAWWLGTSSPAGADASGYLSQAALWAHRQSVLPDVLASLAGWPDVPMASVPLGWRPAQVPAAQVPTYAAGLPMLMAPLWALGGDAAARLVVIVSSAALVVATGALGRFAGGIVGAAVAAALLVASPTVWHQSLGVMSDVPTAAAWALAWHGVVRQRAGQTGVMTALAVLLRPNLAPLAMLPCWAMASWSHRRLVVLCVLAAGTIVAVLQWQWYGSPLQSGYGSASDLFSLGYVTTNLALYAGWMLEAEWTMVAAVVLLGAGAAVRETSTSGSPRVWPAVLFVAGVMAAYLIYAPFERWTYLRFLLPAWPLVAAAAGGAAHRLLTRVTPPRAALSTLVMMSLLMAIGAWRARQLDVWAFTPLADRVVALAAELRPQLERPSVLVAGEQSGAMRHLTGSPILRWDVVDTETLQRALHAARDAGWQVWWVLDQSEEVLVRQRHAALPGRTIDRPADIAAGRLLETRAWREP